MIADYAKRKGFGEYRHNSAVPVGGGTWTFYAQRPGERPQKYTVTQRELEAGYKRSGLSAQSPHRPAHRVRARDRDRPISMTYGVIPPFEEFIRDIRRPNPDNSDGSAYWPEGTDYPMELVSRREIELADDFGGFRSFTPSRYRHKSGYRGNERQIYDFLVFLMDQEDAYDGEEDSPGSLASSIMTTLGYEWI